MASINISDNADLIPVIIARKMNELAKANMSLAKKCRTDFSNEIADWGDTINITSFAKPTVVEKSGGTDISTRQGLTSSKIAVELEKHFVVPISIEDTAVLLSKPEIMNEALTNAAIAMAEKIETYIFNLVVAHGSSSSDYRVGSFGSAIDKALILEIRTAMNEGKIPMTMMKHCLLGSEGIEDIFGISDFTQVLNIGRANELGPLSSGQLPPLMGINFELNQLEPVTTASPDQRSGIAFVTPAIALISRVPRLSQSKGVSQSFYTDPDTGITMRVTFNYDSDTIGDKLNIDCLVGAKIIKPDWVWEVRH